MSEAFSPDARGGLIDPAGMTDSQLRKRPSLKPMPDLGGMLPSPPAASAQAHDTQLASPTVAPLPAVAQQREVVRTVLPVPSMDMGVADVSNLDIGSDPAAVMAGVETDSRMSHLFFGDSIALVPNTTNGCLAYGDSQDNRAWIEILAPNVSMPPNVRDCRFKLVPRRQYVELKLVNRLKREAKWDDFKNLPLPVLPSGTILPPQLAQLVEDFSKKYGISEAAQPHTLAMFNALLAARDEREENTSEEDRQSGTTTIHYGDLVQLVHIATNSMVTVQKGQALERAEKKVSLVLGSGSERSIFRVIPAFKTLSQGEPVTSGDLIVLQTEKKIEGNRYYLHMANLMDDWSNIVTRAGSASNTKTVSDDLRTEVMMGLQCKSDYIVGGEELNASVRPTYWRAVSFFDTKTDLDACKAEDVISFYHKDAEAFLTYDPAYSTLPHFRASSRVSSRARKKSSWLWKLESVRLEGAGDLLKLAREDGITAMDGSKQMAMYRIKHFATNLFLSRNTAGKLCMTENYMEKGTDGIPFSVWVFKQFANADGQSQNYLSVGSLAYISPPGANKKWLAHMHKAVDDHEAFKTSASMANASMSSVSTTTSETEDPTMALTMSERERMQKACLIPQDLPPEREALLVMPARDVDVLAVTQLRRNRATIQAYCDALRSIEMPSFDVSLQDQCPEELPQSVKQVLKCVSEHHDSVKETLVKLVLNCDLDNDPDPMTSDGPANTVMQKLLREMQLLDTVVEIIRLPFELGIQLSWIADKRFRRVQNIVKLSYRLLKQSVKSCEKNAAVVVKHVPLFRKHLGGNLACAATIRELYEGKRAMLNKITEEQIEEYVKLLKKNRDARFVAFLRATCSCHNQPIPANQEKVLRLLLEKADYLLPSLSVSGKGSERTVVARLGALNDKNPELELDLSEYCSSDPDALKGSHRIQNLMDGTAAHMDEKDKAVIYVFRCLELFSELTLGRNQAALKFLLTSQRMHFSYDAILAVIQSSVVPLAFRGCYSDLMVRLWIDRGPQISHPQVHLSRAWSKAQKQVNDRVVAIEEGGNPEHEAMSDTLPVCTTGFTELINVVLELFDNPKNDRPDLCNIGTGSQPGMVDFVTALVEMVDLLIDYHLIAKDRSRADADYETIRKIYHALHRMTDVQSNLQEEELTGKAVSKKRIASLDMLRKTALSCMWRLMNMRGNHRITLAVDAWEEIFEKEEQNRLRMSLEDEELGMHKDRMKSLLQDMFSQSIVSPPEIGSDISAKSGRDKDKTMTTLLSLLHDPTSGLQTRVWTMRILFRHCLQETRCLNELRSVQLLAFPSALSLYDQAAADILRLTALKKHCYRERPEAYSEVVSITRKLMAYITEGGEGSQHLDHSAVVQNQWILFNREVDEAVINLLTLDLVRIEPVPDPGSLLKEMPRAKQEDRKNMIQVLYDFLTALCRGFRPAQEKLFPFVQVFMDHVGIQELNVADTIAEVLRNNTPLLMQVKLGFIQSFLMLIVDYGRKARWLRFFEAVLDADGNPIKRNQDIVLSLLLEYRGQVIDLDCDYTEPHHMLPDTDERNGMSRIDLMAEDDHKRKYGSLLRYHVTCIDLMALSARGKNPTAKVLLFPVVPLKYVIYNILTCSRGKPKSGKKVDLDTAHYVKTAWCKILIDVYLSCNDSSAIRQLLNTPNLFADASFGKQNSVTSVVDISSNNLASLRGDFFFYDHEIHGSVMQDFLISINGLVGRLSAVEPKMGKLGRDELLQFEGVADVHGMDLANHARYVTEIIRGLQMVFNRRDLVLELVQTDMFKKHAKVLHKAVADIASHFWRLGVNKSADAAQNLYREMAKNLNESSVLEAPANARFDASELTVEDRFQRGWVTFSDKLCQLDLGHDFNDSRTLWLNATTALGHVFGSTKTACNEDLSSLDGLMSHLTSAECDPFVRTMGLRCCRSILYVQPDNDDFSDSEREKNKLNFLTGDPPTNSDSRYFHDLQKRIARAGGVEAVLYNLDAQRVGFVAISDTVLAALRLGVALLEGGNTDVQDIFAANLRMTSSQGFFLLCRNLVDAAVEGIREAKKKEKQRSADLHREDSGARKSVADPVQSENEMGSGGGDVGSVLAFSYEVERLLQLMCMGQHTALQDVLRQQKLNKESIDLFETFSDFLKAVEPGVKQAIDNDNSKAESSKSNIPTAQVMIKGFDMLAGAMQGPNRENQKTLSTAGIFDLADLVMAKIKTVDETGVDKTRPLSQDLVKRRSTLTRLPSTGGFQIWPFDNPHERCVEQNKVRSNLRHSVLQCLLAFLEGIQDEAIAEQMLKTLHWGNMTQQLLSCHKYKNNVDVMPTEYAEREGISYYFLMKFMKNFDDTNEVIDPIFNQYPQVFKYYQDRTGYVEIMRDHVLERVYFQLPGNCLPGEELDQDFVQLFEADRSEPDRKRREFLENMCNIISKERFHARIRDSFWLRFTVSNWDHIKSLTFLVCFLIHLILVCGAYVPKDGRKSAEEILNDEIQAAEMSQGNPNHVWFFVNIHPLILNISDILCFVYLAVCLIRAFAFSWAQAPLVFLEGLEDDEGISGFTRDEAEGREGADEEKEDDDPILVVLGANQVGDFSGGDQLKIDSPKGEAPDSNDGSTDDAARKATRKVAQVCAEPMVWYEVMHLLFAIFAVVWSEPLLTVYGLFEICLWSGSKTAIDAIRFNMGKMMQTMLLGLLVTYTWMCVGISTLRSEHDDNCSNMFQCFSSYLYLSIRGDGVKDVMVDAVFPTNIVDALVIPADKTWAEFPFMWRLFWDVSFWLLFILILTAIISGIIIDAFSGMRDEADSNEQDLRTVCFVCGLGRFEVDSKGMGFDYHIVSEHNPRWYLYFLLSIREKRVTEMTGQEAYVRRSVWPNLDYSWIPKETTMSLRNDDINSEMHEVTTRIGNLESRFESVDKQVHAIARSVAGMSDALERMAVASRDSPSGMMSPRRS